MTDDLIKFDDYNITDISLKFTDRYQSELTDIGWHTSQTHNIEDVIKA